MSRYQLIAKWHFCYQLIPVAPSFYSLLIPILVLLAVLSDSKLSQTYNNDNDIDCEDISDTDPSWKSTKDVEQLLKEDEDQVDFLYDQSDFETTSQFNLNDHLESKHISIEEFLKSKVLPSLFNFETRNTMNNKKKVESIKNKAEISKKTRVVHKCDICQKSFNKMEPN